jgi:hypothetical protein
MSEQLVGLLREVNWSRACGTISGVRDDLREATRGNGLRLDSRLAADPLDDPVDLAREP